MATKAYIKQVIKKRPIIRGVLAYAVIWPTSNLIQQTIAGKRFPNYDWKEAARFLIFGSCYVAPTLYCWIRFSTKLWPRSTFRTAIHKAVVEQFTYSPFAMISFFFGMSLLEGRTLHESAKEVRAKFFPTWQTGVLVWPVLQTINFGWISEKNRVPYVSICSLAWTCFLTYMKHKDEEIKNVEKEIFLSIPHSTTIHQTTVQQPIVIKQLL